MRPNARLLHVRLDAHFSPIHGCGEFPGQETRHRDRNGCVPRPESFAEFDPDSGRDFAIFAPNMVRLSSMSPAPIPSSLLDHLVRTGGLGRSEARRMVEEVLSFYDETPEAFVIRRHRELQAEGMRNDAIFARVTAEVDGWRFRAPPLSERQIRRIVYG